jgi:hypothetical protein
LRSQKEIVRKINLYKDKLATAIEEKELYSSEVCPDVDLIIFSLVDKLETLLWVLEMDLPEGDILDKLMGVIH